jgi:hypothetical protein
VKKDIAKDMFGVEKAYIGFSGSADEWPDVVSWFANPTKRQPKCSAIEFILLTDEKKIYHATNMRNWLEIVEPHFAIGSGMQYAIAAMESGKTPIEACKVASKFDRNTGLGYKQYKL